MVTLAVEGLRTYTCRYCLLPLQNTYNYMFVCTCMYLPNATKTDRLSRHGVYESDWWLRIMLVLCRHCTNPLEAAPSKYTMLTSIDSTLEALTTTKLDLMCFISRLNYCDWE